MKVLLLSPFFFPEQISTGKYNTYLANALVLAGHNVTVLTSHPLYPNWHAEKSKATLPGIKIKRGGYWIAYPRSTVLRRAILELWYAWFTLFNYFRLETRPDIVIPIFPPSLFLLLLHSLMPRVICRVGVIHDLQGVYAMRSKGLIYRILKSAIGIIEKKCFRGCDRLIFLSASMANRAVTEYKLDSERCSVCYPFVSINEDGESSFALANKLSPFAFNVVYSGALSEKQNPEGLFAFMNEIAGTQTNVTCHIFSAGTVFEQIRMSNLGRTNCKVQFHALVPAEQLAELYGRSDVQIIPQALNTSDGSLPSKLPNLLAAGVPVFAICESGSELGDLVNDAKAGMVANTWDTAKLVELFKFYRNNLGTETKQERQMRLRAFIESKFSMDSVIKIILTAAKNKRESG